MRTTDSIIEDLIKRRDQRLEAGEQVDVSAVEQQIVAHQQLARLRTERAERVKDKNWVRVGELNADIQHWLRFVDEDVDDRVVAQPSKDSQRLVPDPAPDTTKV